MQQLLEFIANHPFLWSAVAAVIAALIANEIWRSLRGDRPLPPSEAVRLINSRDAVVVDVRSAGDFKKGHLLNAINIPLAGITERANEISKNKECTILCYCAMGSTSQQACQRLQKLGYSHVHSLKGGINGWQAAGLPITRK